MQILTSPAQLQRLEGILKKSLPLALPVYGAVLNINRGNPGDSEVLVDKWPDFGAVLARPRGEVARGDMGHCRERGGWHGALVCSGSPWVPSGASERQLLEHADSVLPGFGGVPGAAGDTRLPALGRRLHHHRATGRGDHGVTGPGEGQRRGAGHHRVLHLRAPRPQHHARAPAGPRRAAGLPAPLARGPAEPDVALRGQRPQPALPGRAFGALPPRVRAGRRRGAPQLGADRPFRDGRPRLHAARAPPARPHAGGTDGGGAAGAGPGVPHLRAHGAAQRAHAAAAGADGPPAPARDLPLHPAQPRHGQGRALKPRQLLPGAGQGRKASPELKSVVGSLMAAVGLCLPPALTVAAVTRLGGSRVTSPGTHPVTGHGSQLFSAPPREGLRQMVAPAVSHPPHGMVSPAAGGGMGRHRGCGSPPGRPGGDRQ
ncbi:collagen alpha-2(I) chain-like isoform X1 [Corapipo altera]|uniref:collagen alpha-2(I) chain-like isoform X1 n=1 Tax=Corapipo altera TaxID=415028 RepID=UPI000FD63A0A|nr:collagen alpha-2(I) chain-like isoform X1 [Corapipo altera]XP_027488483.1 collagen alpha-2(I) chain-like isoform X1 [Corapipo altera]